MEQSDPRGFDRFLRPERYRWQDPEVVLDSIGLLPGMVMADVGAGAGFFTLPAAKRVGGTGMVYALDIDSGALDRLGERAAAEGIRNVECLVSQADSLLLSDATVDLALVANVLHEVPNRAQFLREIARVLRPDGVVAVVEWRKEQVEMGPPLAERLTYGEVEGALRAAGYEGIEPFEVGPRHYGVRAKRGKS